MNSKVHQLTETIKSYFRTNIIIAKFPIFLVAVALLFLCIMCTPTNAAPTITITYPSNESTVIQYEAIYGTSADISNGDQIWILGYNNSSNRYYPRPESESIQENGEWAIPMEIGSNESTSAEYDIIAVLANTEANEILSTYAKEYIDTNIWPDVKKIPVGAVEYARITVTRFARNPIIEIAYPSNESTVNQNEITHGTSTNIPDGYQVWILGYSNSSNRYYPRPESESIQENEEWSIPIEIGSDEDAGVKYDIIAMLADAEANETLSTYAKEYIENNNGWPVGAKEYDRITVIRKGSLLPVADFSTSVTGGYAPLSVTFTDISQNATSRSWDVNSDGIEDSTEANFTYEYASAGTYTVKLTAINAIGTNEKVATIIVDKKSSGGSSGGGGGGGGSPEPAKNVEVKEISQVFIANGKVVKFDFTRNATCVVYVGFNAIKNAGKTTTIAEQLKNKSALVPKLPEGDVYKSFNIWVGNSGYATSKNIEKPVLCFKVEKTWLQNESVDHNSITLNRYGDENEHDGKDGTWTQLPANMTGEDGEYLYFTSEVPSYGSFAITSTPIMQIEDKSGQIPPEKRSGDMNKSTDEKGNSTKHPNPNSDNFKIACFVMVVGGIILIILYLGGIIKPKKENK